MQGWAVGPGAAGGAAAQELLDDRRGAGEKTPHGIQHLLCRASWDADAVRDDVRDYVVGHLHDKDAVLVVDENGEREPYGTGTIRGRTLETRRLAVSPPGVSA